MADNLMYDVHSHSFGLGGNRTFAALRTNGSYAQIAIFANSLGRPKAAA
ncbi:MAG: hypothetical protein ABJT31_00590 [Hyphomicrobiales bacterium]